MKTFCVLPWIHRFTNVGGEIQVCCSSEEYENNIRDDTGATIRIVDVADDAQIMNSRFMRELRLEMVAGRWPDLCKRCQVTEESGGVSRRQIENRQLAQSIEDLLISTREDGTIPVKIISSDFRIGNVCNLACRMCNPRSSLKWVSEWQKIDPNLFDFSREHVEELKSYNWYKSPKILSQLRAQLPTLRHLHFAGGEPLIVPEMLNFLRLCVESGYSKNIDLTYNTNITRIPEEATKLWPKFRAVRLLCSIDGFGEVNEMIRYPSRWNTIDANLRDIEKNHEAYGLKEVLVMCTVQVYNVFYLGDLFDYLADNFKFVRQIPHLVDLHFPNRFRTQVLPGELKEMALASMQQVEARARARIAEGLIPAYQEDSLESLRGAMNFLIMDDRSGLLPEFVQVSGLFDRARGKNTFDVLPALRSLQIYAAK